MAKLQIKKQFTALKKNYFERFCIQMKGTNKFLRIHTRKVLYIKKATLNTSRSPRYKLINMTVQTFYTYITNSTLH